MFKLTEMTNTHLNRKLAELMGYTVEPSVQIGVHRLIKGGKIQATSSTYEGLMWSYAPDYCSDPAASLEVQAAAIEINPREYVRNLQELKWECSFSGISKIKVAELITASPRERAEAAYMTLQDKGENEDDLE